MTMAPIYLDHCAGTPCDPRVVDAMLPYFTRHFGNPASRDHGFGWVAAEAVEEAREHVARLIGAAPGEIVFTSGATESVNLALKGLLEAAGEGTRHIITSRTEHSAVLDTCDYLEKKGVRITYLKTGSHGEISLEELEEAICRDTVCIALMYANNETGVINPVSEIAAIAGRHGVPFLCDATQAAGKIPVDVSRAAADLIPFSSHKMYGPKGTGALFIRRSGALSRFAVMRQQHGGAHEKGLRSGTLNTPGIIGFGKAAELCLREMREEAGRLQKLRDRMESRLQDAIPGTSVNGGPNRLPHVSNLLFPAVDAGQLVLSVSQQLAVSRGSACSGIVQRPSHVLLAMGLSAEAARNSVRISLGRFTDAQEADIAVEILSEAVGKLQPAGSASPIV